VALVGIDWIEEAAVPGGKLVLLTVWEVQSTPLVSLKAFVHLLGQDGVLRAQHDGLGSPPLGWSPGDLILQRHVLGLPSDLEPGTYTLQVGLYQVPDGPRLPVAGTDRLLLPPLEVEVPS
jgi:hypothetical protein